MKNPLFSVLMASYNNGSYIKEAIQSILDQTYENWELIIVDDASRDDSVSVIAPFLADKRIRLIRHKKNLGCGATKKRCASEAKGEILGVLDADDVLDKRALEIMTCQHLEKNDKGLIHSHLFECDESLNIVGTPDWIGETDKTLTNLLRPRVSHFRTFKKHVYDLTSGYDPELKAAVDKDIVYKLEELSSLAFVDKPLYYYRTHRGGISRYGNTQRAAAYMVFAQYKAFKRRKNTNIPNLTTAEMANNLIGAGMRFLYYRDLKNAGKAFALSFRLKPINPKGYYLNLQKMAKMLKHSIVRSTYVK